MQIEKRALFELNDARLSTIVFDLQCNVRQTDKRHRQRKESQRGSMMKMMSIHCVCPLVVPTRQRQG